MKSIETQNNKVLEYMIANGSIDTFRAFNDLRICRLSARIYDLRKSGVKIGGENCHEYDEHGKLKKWKVYWIEKS